ncbi:MAG TPA: DUF2207 domain-containing protein, partial [Chloroflexia bacterium]|nr:DUF2207 domain-containing protein [Chloroflexia bacterium]
APPAGAQSAKTRHWTADQVTLAVQPDATFDVREQLAMVADAGTWHSAYRDIDTTHLTAIDNVSVAEEGAGAYRLDSSDFDLDKGVYGPPQTFQVVGGLGSTRIVWFYAALAPPGHKTFTLHYTVHGGLGFYASGDRLVWAPFLSPDQGHLDQAQLTIQVPPAVNLTDRAAQVAVLPAGAGTVQRTAQQAVWRATPEAASFTATLQWPHGRIAGRPEAWQVAADAEQAAADLPGRLQLGATILSAILFLGGLLFWGWRWYRANHTPQAAALSGPVTEPPSDLPPGLVAVLTTGHPDARALVATLLDLARRGHVQIAEIPHVTKKGAARYEFAYRVAGQEGLAPYEAQLLAGLGAQGATPVRLTQLQNQFYTKVDGIASAMYAALIARHYLPYNPATVNRRLLILAGVCGVLALLAFGGAFLDLTISPALGVLIPALLLNGAAAFWLSDRMVLPGARWVDEAARWQAYGRSLAAVPAAARAAAAAEIAADLPYAAALGVEDAYLRQFHKPPLPLAVPPYYQLAPVDATASAAPAPPRPDILTSLARLIKLTGTALVSAPAVRTSKSYGGGGSVQPGNPYAQRASNLDDLIDIVDFLGL